MLARFKRYISEQHLIPDGATVLLAVSGGRDSVAMADLFHRAGIPFEIAHCNFNLRPGDCDRDEAFVRQLAASYGAQCHVARFDTRAFAAENGMSIEEAARHLRYEYFTQLITHNSKLQTILATAHHSDDTIETFFLNLFRGTGLHGLHGIRPISVMHINSSPKLGEGNPSEARGEESVTVVRPMLCFSRADIDAYIAERGLLYVEDHTNAELDARRNRIRHELMPLLRRLYPSVDATMLANIERLHATEQILDAYVDQLRAQLIKPYTSQLPAAHYQLPPIDALDLKQLPLPTSHLTMLFELLRPYGFNASTVEDILNSSNQAIKHSGSSTGKLFYSPTHVAELHRGQLLIAPLAQSGNQTIKQSDTRHWRPGDRFRPKGMKGTRLVSDFLKDLHLSRIEKQYVLVRVDSDDRILAVVGLRDAAL